jgi:signal transduction histidine kinase/CheY-like chemotaxis protein/GAF domain-containing protein
MNGDNPTTTQLRSVLLKHIEDHPPGMRAAINEICECKQAEDEAMDRPHESHEPDAELDVLRRLAAEAKAEPSVDRFLATAANLIISHLNPDVVLLHADRADRLLLKWSESKHPGFVHESAEEDALKACLCGAAAGGRPFYSTDIRDNPSGSSDACSKSGIRSLAALPLQCRNKVVGVLALGSLGNRNFSRHETLLEILAGQVALGLENIWLNEKVELQVSELEENRGKLDLADREIRKTKGLLQSVFDGISDPLIMVDEDMRIRALNASATGYFRVSRGEAVGKTCYEVLWGRTEPCEGCKLRNALSDMNMSRFQRRSFADPGSMERVDIYPFTHSCAEKGAIVQVTDLTERFQNPNELMLADKLISLGVLVSSVAHEINNPNNFIMLNAPILNDVWGSITPILERYYRDNGEFIMGGLEYTEMRDEIPGLLSGIVEGARRIERIVKDLKDYSRHDSVGGTQLVDVNKVIEGAIRLLNHMIRKSSNHFSVEFGDDLPLINGNVQRLEQVVINLIQNACQALTDNNQRISVKSSYNKKENGIVIEVSDEGMGIPPDVIPHITEPFFSTKQGDGGTGLGLSVCSDIIKELRGKIDVESREGTGSTFTVFVPLMKKEKRARILVVDDDETLREGIAKVLETNENYLVRKASNGAEAFLSIGHRRPDLIILDIHMPDMDGVEVCRLLKEREELSKIKVIVITGFPDSPKGKKIVGLGFTNILPKPFTIPDLTGMVRSILDDGASDGLDDSHQASAHFMNKAS